MNNIAKILAIGSQGGMVAIVDLETSNYVTAYS
jgi:hypothetical protein